ncbi:uncharacterized protein [Typha angustifolia]|uniref:uncharacterized protein n=1 Tax=Typha angustifolia TaxID=59011 RepID=UPI003C2DE452
MPTEERNLQQGANGEQLWEAKLGKRIMQFFGVICTIPICFVLTSLPEFHEIKLHHKILCPIWGISITMTFLFAFLLIAFLMCHDHFHHRLLTSFIFLAGLALAASSCILLVFAKVNAIIALLVPLQKLVLVGMIAYKSTSNFVYDEDYELEMECGFDLSKLTSQPAFAAQMSLIFAYQKTSSSFGARSSRADLAITYFASTLCLCSLMITCMPLRFGGLPVMKTHLLATVKVLNYAMLVALAWTATTLAVEFLDGVVVLSFTLLLIAPAFFAFREFQNGAGEVQEQGANVRVLDLMKEYKDICIGSMVAGYYAILVVCVYSMDSVGESHSWPIKFFVFLLLTAIICGLALTPFTLRPPRPEFLPAVAKIMVCFAGLLILIFWIMVVYACVKQYN